MIKNNRYCRPTNEGKSYEYAPVIIPPKTSAPTEQEYNDAGWYRNEIQPPQPPEGKIVSSTTYVYDEEENCVVAEYTFEDAPKPIRVFSKLKLYIALSSLGLWPAFEEWLKSQDYQGINAYIAYTNANNLTDENPLFLQWFERAKAALGVSDEVAEQILTLSETDY